MSFQSPGLNLDVVRKNFNMVDEFKAFQIITTKRVTRGNEECKTFNVTFSQFQFILSVISTDFLFPLFMELHLLN